MAASGAAHLVAVADVQLLSGLVHSAVDQILGRASQDLPNCSADLELSPQDRQSAINFVQTIFNAAAKDPSFNLDKQLESLRSEQADCVKKCFEIRRHELANFWARRAVAKNTELIVDYDWKLKFIMGSSSLSTLREPIVQMDFTTLKVDQDDQETKSLINFEMNLQQVEQMIKELEKIENKNCSS